MHHKTPENRIRRIVGHLLLALASSSGVGQESVTAPGADHSPPKLSPADREANLREAMRTAETRSGRTSEVWLHAALDSVHQFVAENRNADSRNRLLESVREIIRANGFTGTLADLRAEQLQAQSFDRENRFAEAGPHWSRCCELAGKVLPHNQSLIADLFLEKSFSEERNLDGKSAIDSLHQALTIRETLGHDKEKSTFILRKLAMISRLLLKDNSQAIRYQRQCIELHERFDNLHSTDYLTDLSLWGNLHRGFDSKVAASSLEQVVRLGKQMDRSPEELLNDRLLLAEVHQEQGNLLRAIEVYGEIVSILFKATTNTHPQTGEIFEKLAGLQEQAGNADAAKQTREMLEKLVGPEPTSLPQQIAQLVSQISQLRKERKFSEARARVADLIRLERLRCVDQGEELATALLGVARSESLAGEARTAEALAREVISLRESSGSDTVRLSEAWYYLGMILRIEGKHPEALAASQQALNLRLPMGLEHPQVIESMMMVGSHLTDLGDMRQARGILDKARVGLDNAQGPARANLVSVLQSLALLSMGVGDWQQAYRYLTDAEQAAIKTTGAGSLLHNLVRAMLAITLVEKKDLQGAASLFQAIDEHQDLLRAQVPQVYAAIQSAFAHVRGMQGETNEALQLAQSAVDALGQIGLMAQQGECQANVAYFQEKLGRESDAVASYQLAFATLSKHSPKNYFRLAAPLENVARLELRRGNVQAASDACHKSLEIRETQLRNSLGGLAERQQLALTKYLRDSLDLLLSIPGLPDEFVFTRVLQWKGQVFTAQRRARTVATPESDEKRIRLRELAGELSRLIRVRGTTEQALTKPEEDRIGELVARHEELEASLAFEATSVPLEVPSIEAILETLPNDVALVDYLIYKRLPTSADQSSEKHAVAFVARRNHPVVRIELGAISETLTAIEQWREVAIGPFVEGHVLENLPPLQELTKRVHRGIWQPLQSSLSGVTSVILCPDGELGRFPFSALPGTNPGSYLLEELAISIVAIPAMLPELQQEPPPDRAWPGKRLLLVGEIDYEAPANLPFSNRPSKRNMPKMAPKSSSLGDFPKLEFARDELRHVRDAWQLGDREQDITELTGHFATEAMVRLHAAEANCLHFCTHGFSDAPDLVSASARTGSEPLANQFVGELVGWHPGLLSGLALTGANRQSDSTTAVNDDGQITALEVAGMNLHHVDLVVLSACQTAIGKVEAGEGMLGLQRAFQVSGAKSVVSSLWPVSSQATQVLMKEFYGNLWGKQLNRREALRQAQLTILRNYSGDAGELRGRVVPRSTASLPPKDQNAQAPPFFWAAFQLSGDFR
jgi:CHAT domain-containing protein/tetratricopeptide (TPR) repeat protein